MTQSGPWRSYWRRQTWKLQQYKNKNFNKVCIKFCMRESTLFGRIRKCLVKISKQGTSLAVQWLRFCAFNAGIWIWSMVEELRSHRATLWGPIKIKISQKKKKEKYISKTKSIWDKLQAKWGFCISGGQGRFLAYLVDKGDPVAVRVKGHKRLSVGQGI